MGVRIQFDSTAVMANLVGGFLSEARFKPLTETKGNLVRRAHTRQIRSVEVVSHMVKARSR